MLKAHQLNSVVRVFNICLLVGVSVLIARPASARMSIDQLPPQAAAMVDVQEIFEPTGNFPESDYFKVAVIQWAPADTPIVKSVQDAERVKSRSRAQLAAYIRKAALSGARLIVAPELGVVGYPASTNTEDSWSSVAQIAPYAETIPGPTTNYFASLARELQVFLQIGGVEALGGKYYNVAFVLDPAGKLVAKHHKINFYGNEGDYFTHGTSATTFTTPAGKVGVMICADIYFPALVGTYAGQVSAVTVSASWAVPDTGWDYFVQGAVEMRAYLLASNNTYFPDAGVVRPDGSTQSHIRQSKTGIAFGYLPLSAASPLGVSSRF